MDVTEIITRLGVATLLGAGLGLNRYLRHKSVGIRTLGMVALVAAAIVTAMTESFGGEAASRGIQGVLTGIGFVGAGLIVHSTDAKAVHGLTTATTVWLAAAIGVLCGLAVWRIALICVAFATLLLIFGGHIEKWVAARMNASDRDD